MKNRFLILSFALTCICAMSVARTPSFETVDHAPKKGTKPSEDMSFNSIDASITVLHVKNTESFADIVVATGIVSSMSEIMSVKCFVSSKQTNYDPTSAGYYSSYFHMARGCIARS